LTAVCALTLIIVSACVASHTGTEGFCRVAGDSLPIKMSKLDTEETQKQIIRINARWYKLCL
jgi:hypothetical protein